MHGKGPRYTQIWLRVVIKNWGREVKGVSVICTICVMNDKNNKIKNKKNLKMNINTTFIYEIKDTQDTF